jgi:3-keto-5-aminohexanoate cleavage enzyme
LLEALRPDLAAIQMRSTDLSESIEVELREMNRLSVRPEHHCFDSGHVASLETLLELDVLDVPLRISMVMGVVGGIRPTARNLAHMADQIPGGPDGIHNWGVVTRGREQWPLLAAALSLGGDIRVGFEDNVALPDGTLATSNGELVEAARRLIELSGRRVATPTQARSVLGVPCETSPAAA